MAEEIALNPTAKNTLPDAQGVDAVREMMEKFMETASVNSVYGEPIQHGDTLIIPAAEVVSGLGFGIGYGSGAEAESNSTGSGGGGGGGGKVLSRPVAIIVADPQRVHIEPVFDWTKIALAALTAAGFMIGMWGRMSNPKKAFPKKVED